jgi:hypothetical protein
MPIVQSGRSYFSCDRRTPAIAMTDDPNEDLTAWIGAGIRRQDALAWRRWRYTLKQATPWIKAGVTSGLDAAQWETAGVTPATVARWRAAGIDAAEAVHWHELGYSVEQAREHKAHSRTPDNAFGQGPRLTMPMSFPARPIHYAQATADVGTSVDVEKFLAAGVHGELMHGYLRAGRGSTHLGEGRHRGTRRAVVDRARCHRRRGRRADPGGGLPGPVLAMVNAHIGASPNPPLVCWRGVFLVRMRGDQGGVDVHDRLTAIPAARPAGQPAPRPEPAPAQAGGGGLTSVSGVSSCRGRPPRQ